MQTWAQLFAQTPVDARAPDAVGSSSSTSGSRRGRRCSARRWAPSTSRKLMGQSLDQWLVAHGPDEEGRSSSRSSRRCRRSTCPRAARSPRWPSRSSSWRSAIERLEDAIARRARGARRAGARDDRQDDRRARAGRSRRDGARGGARTTSASFIDAVGDLNPVHSDADYAATTPFKEPDRARHLHGGLISAVDRHRGSRAGRRLSLAEPQVRQARAGGRHDHRAGDVLGGAVASAIACGCRPSA